MSWRDQVGSYSMQYVPANVVEALKRSHLLGVFFRLDTDPGLHLWMGVNDIPAGFDSVDPNGTIYLGAGRLINVPTLEILVNGQAGSCEFGVSGIDPGTAQRLLETMPDVEGKSVMIGLTTLDQYFQPMSAIIPIWSGVASHVNEGTAAVPVEETRTINVSLAVITGSFGRSRASGLVWSPAQHKARYPSDKFCDSTPRLARGVAPIWPP